MQLQAFADETARKLHRNESLPDENAPFSDWALIIKKRMLEKMSFGNLKPRTIDKEIEHFILFGNCAEAEEFKPVTRNITLLTPVKQNWQIHYLACPLDAYFPVPFEDQEHPLLHFSAYNNAYNYCKAKLQQLVTELREHKSCVTFHFHNNDFFDLGTIDVKMENKFQIVHCFKTADAIGLANLLPVADRLMVNDNPNAVLITEADTWHRFVHAESIIEYVGKALCCPISMIPTIYGMQLIDHLELGCSVPAKFHDSKSANAFILKWQKALPYSSNMKLSFSGHLDKCMYLLAQACFTHSYVAENPKLPLDEDEDILPTTNLCDQIKELVSFLPYSPMTYYYVIKSLFNRCGWVVDYQNSKPNWTPLTPFLFPPQFVLTWKAHFVMATGQPFQHYSANSLFPRDEILRRKQNDPVELWLVSADHVKQHGAKPGKIMPESFFEKAQCITDIRCIKTEDCYPALTMDEFEPPQPFSIFLPKDKETHQLESSVQFCIVDAETRALIFSCDFFSNFDGKDWLRPVYSNLNPRGNPPECEKGLHIFSCSETK